LVEKRRSGRRATENRTPALESQSFHSENNRGSVQFWTDVLLRPRRKRAVTRKETSHKGKGSDLRGENLLFRTFGGKKRTVIPAVTANVTCSAKQKKGARTMQRRVGVGPRKRSRVRTSEKKKGLERIDLPGEKASLGPYSETLVASYAKAACGWTIYTERRRTGKDGSNTTAISGHRARSRRVLSVLKRKSNPTTPTGGGKVERGTDSADPVAFS